MLKFRRIVLHPILLIISLSTIWILASCSQTPDKYSHYNLGVAYLAAGEFEKAIASYKQAIKFSPSDAKAHTNLGIAYSKLGRYQKAIASLKKAIRITPYADKVHYNLGVIYQDSGQYLEAISEYKVALKINPDYALARNSLNRLEQGSGDESLANEKRLLEEERKDIEVLRQREADRLARERFRLEEERKRLESNRLAEENRRQQPPEEKSPQSGTGSGFFISKMGHVITNAHVVKDCNRVTVGDSSNKQVPAKVIRTDPRNDLALLKLSTLEMASAESKALIQKLNIAVMPLATNGLLRSEDVRLGEKVLVAGYPFGDVFSNTIKVTSGIVSATLGAGDDSGQFQLDAAVQPGNSGGPIYDSGGNIVGVVISQLDKLKMAKAIGSLPENVNFGIKASTVRQFLISSGLPSKKSEQAIEKSTEQLANIAKNQALMVMCFN
jgi:S1-C subfamily serine protease